MAIMAYGRAAMAGNETPFAGIVNGRVIKRRKDLTNRAEKESRQLRTGHHPLVMTMYSAEYHTMHRCDRRQLFLPCPVCGRRSRSPLEHLFVCCTDLVTQRLRDSMWAVMADKCGRTEGLKHVGTKDKLWLLLFQHPEVALRYLQEVGAIPRYRILLNDDDLLWSNAAAPAVSSDMLSAWSSQTVLSQLSSPVVPLLSSQLVPGPDISSNGSQLAGPQHESDRSPTPDLDSCTGTLRFEDALDMQAAVSTTSSSPGEWA
ncbi:hypothetical protein DIPPA_28935 [Diplonema papillatum]|nr:hypothetical protein DIPPA_10264 [Diplonema papillatum]KAJ9443334.1 hypothetical protein DIPPA_28935 [Diplonema papillatum]